MIQRLLAPFLPFATEEAWSWWKAGSIHQTQWPTATLVAGLDHAGLDHVCEVMARVRRAKTEAQTSQKTPVTRLVVSGPAVVLEAVRIGQVDLTEAGTIEVFEYLESDALDCTVQL